MALRFTRFADDNDNTCWEANSNISSEDSEMIWKVAPSLFRDKVRWTLRGTDIDMYIVNDRLDIFDTAEEAKQFCEAKDDELIREGLATGMVREGID